MVLEIFFSEIGLHSLNVERHSARSKAQNAGKEISRNARRSTLAQGIGIPLLRLENADFCLNWSSVLRSLVLMEVRNRAASRELRSLFPGSESPVLQSRSVHLQEAERPFSAPGTARPAGASFQIPEGRGS